MWNGLLFFLKNILWNWTVVTLSLLFNRVIKRISLRRIIVRRRERERKREKEWRCDERMKNAWNYHGICITAGFQARGWSELESISRIPVAVDRDRHGYASQVSLPTWMAKTFATPGGGKGNDSSQLFNSSGKLVYLERRSLLLELPRLNAIHRKFLRVCMYVCTRHVRTHMRIFHVCNTPRKQENPYVLQNYIYSSRIIFTG